MLRSDETVSNASNTLWSDGGCDSISDTPWAAEWKRITGCLWWDQKITLGTVLSTNLANVMIQRPLSGCCRALDSTGGADDSRTFENQLFVSLYACSLKSNPAFLPPIIQIPVESKHQTIAVPRRRGRDRQRGGGGARFSSQQSRLILLKCLIALAAETFYCCWYILLPWLRFTPIPRRKGRGLEENEFWGSADPPPSFPPCIQGTHSLTFQRRGG